MKNDRLFELMMLRLERSDLAEESESDFILNVTAEYMAELMAQGNIPHFLMNVVERDLNEELIEIYRKKTYGSVSPKDYRNRKARVRSS
ncbi:MAG: hypothetical protein KF767_13930 [Bdellovibrionaceae bacterium]|nr:hypothetical protein [Pseudobdellovibrionaceae bacterium]